VINVAGGYHPSPQPHTLLLNDGTPVHVSGGLIRVFQRYRVIEDQESRTSWRVAIVAYSYALDAEAGQELFSYQWHPAGPSPIEYPHVHIGADARAGHSALIRAHFPTGHVALGTFLRLLITDFAIPPRRRDWDRTLAKAETAEALQVTEGINA
jgi:hypothetical protein